MLSIFTAVVISTGRRLWGQPRGLWERHELPKPK